MSGINQFQKPQSPIDGILKGLQAVQAVYGINTEAAQQKLLESRLKSEGIGQEKAQLELDSEKSLASGKPNTYALSKMGYIPSSGYSNDSEATPPPQSGGKLTPEDFRAPQNSTPINQDAERSPLMQSIAPPQAAAKPAQAGGSSFGRFVDANGKSWINLAQLESQQKYTQGGLNIDKTVEETKHIRQEMANATQEEKRKEQGQVGDYQKDFTERYPGVKDAMDEIGEHNSISKLLLSGNKQGVQLGGAKLALVASGVKRLGPQLLELGVDQSILGKIQNAISEGRTGFKTPEEIDALNKVNNLMGQEANQRLDQLGTSAAAQVGARLNQDPMMIKQKYLLPASSQFKPMDSRVAPHPQTGQNTLWRIKDNGKYSPVISNE